MKKWVVALVAVLAVTVSADNPHFIKASSSLDNDGNLVVSWKEAGLGSNTSVSYTASANSTANYQCVNHGGRCPAASNKQDVAGPVSSTGTFSSGKNGQITASLTVEPPASTLSCPGNQIVQLAAVSYDGIVLSDDTNGVTANVAPSLAATFFDCP